MKTRQEYLAETQCPGKFTGQRAYVPYFWDAYLNGLADSDNGTTLVFYVMAEDKAIFPELKRRRAIKLLETEQGFVIEV